MPIIEVQSYSGYKGDERPVSFVRDGGRLMVEEILERWRSPDAEHFKVRADDGKLYVLRRCFSEGQWSLDET